MPLNLSQKSKIYKKQPPEVFNKKGVLRNFAKFTGKHLCQSLFFIKVAVVYVCIFIKKETLALTFFYDFGESFKNIFFTDHLWATASDM